MLVTAAGLGLCSCKTVHPSTDPEAPVKILTYNIEGPSATNAKSIGYWPNRKDHVISLIDKGDYDLIGTQETSREMLNDNGMKSIYDLSGRKIQLEDQTRKLQKGIYIINGQKRTVK